VRRTPEEAAHQDDAVALRDRGAMTTQEVDSLKIGDRVQAGTRTGILEFVVSNVFLVKWDGRRDSDAYTREAFEKQFVFCSPR
jgi:hypothetical protein